MPKTTAQLLGQYQSELAENNIDPELITEIVRHAAFMLHSDMGLCVAGNDEAAK